MCLGSKFVYYFVKYGRTDQSSLRNGPFCDTPRFAGNGGNAKENVT